MIQPKNNRKSLGPGSRVYVWLLAFFACCLWAAPALGLGTPTGVTGTTSAATPAIISWSSVATATSYTVYRGTTSGGETSLATGIATTSYNDTTATRGTTYYYTVYAVNGGTTSSASSEVIVDPVNTSSPYYQINANGPGVSPFAADAYYTPSNAYSVSATINVAAPNSAPQAVYQTERNSVGGTNAGTPVTYTLPGLTANGTYVVRLHFSENVFTAAGGRKFNVSINGTSVLSQFDVWAAANSSNKSVVRNFNVTADGTGKIAIVLSNGTVDQLMINGIEVLSGSVTAAPTGLAAVMSTATSSSVTWGTVAGAATYNLYRSTSAGTEGSTPYQTGLASASYTDTGLTPGTTYYYKVVGVNAQGESALSSEASWTPLPAPTGVAATVGNAQVSLAWTAPTGATSYKVFRSTTSGSSYTQIGTPSSVSYTDSTAANNTTYFYVVQAVNATATSGNSSEVAAVPGGANGLLGWWKLDDDTGTSVTDGSGFSNTGTFTSAGWATGRNGYAGSFNGSSSEVDTSKGVIATANTFSVACWVKLSSAGNYHETFISQDGTNVSGFFLQYLSNTNNFGLQMENADITNPYGPLVTSTTTLTFGTWYHLIGVYDAVNAQIKLYVNGSLQGTQSYTTPWSATGNTIIGRAKYNGTSGDQVNGLIDDVRIYNRLLTAAEIATISAYPTSVTATQASATSATIAWTAFPSATSYNLYRSTTAGGEGGTPYLTGLTGTSYTNTGLTSGTTYYYKLSATTASGESAQSDEVTLTPVATPTGLAAALASATSTTLTWTAVTGATSYNLYRSTTAGGEGSTPVQTGLTGTSYTNTGLTSGTTYYYKLTAATATSESSQSSEVSLTPVGVPTSVAATPGNAQVALTWTAAAGATSYTVYRGTTPGSETSLATGIATASYTDSTAANNTTYFYVVQAVSAGTTSANSSEVAATPGGANGLLGWWKLDENTGTTANDGSGFANTGTFTGAGWATGRNGYTGSFNGSSSYIDAGKGVIATANSFSVACWINLNSMSGYQTFMSQDGVNCSGFFLQTQSTGNPFRFLMNPSDASISGTSVPSLTVPVTGTWYHLIGMYDAPNSQIKLYVNGTLQGTASFTTPWNATGDTVIGRGKFYGGPSDYVNGLIDDARVYNRLLTAAEIATISAYPTSVTATQASATSATIAWTAFSNATSYNLYRSTTAGGEGGTPYLTGLTGTSYTNTGLTSGTTYYYKLSATTASGESAQSNEVTLTPVAAPTSLAVTEASATSAALTWAAVTGATSYNLYRSTTAGGEGATPIQTGLTGTSYTNTGLTTNTAYYYKLTAATATSESAQSSEVTITPLAIPTSLAVTQASATSSTVTWSAVTGATSYNLYRSTTAGGEGSTPIQTGLTGTSYTNTGLTSGTTYYYKLTAVNATAESPQSSEVSLTPLATPTGLAATEASATSVSLTWSAVTGATTYNVYRSTTAGGEGATPYATGLASPSYTNTGLTTATTYYYKVAAVNATTTSAQSSEVNLTPLAAPTGLAVTQASATSSTLTWVAVTGATSYNLYRSTTAGGEGATPIQTGLTGTSYTNTGLTSGTTYYYKLTAVTGSAESAQSSEVTLTPVAAPTGLAVSQASATSSTVTWTAVTGAASYNLYRSTTAGGEGSTPVQTGLTGTSYTNTGLTSGTTYYYKLTAVTATSESAQSSEVTYVPLATPTGLVATEASATSSTLTWSAVTGATSYNLYRSTTAGGEGATPVQTGLTGTSYTNTGLTSGTTYYYKLTAVNAVAESGQSTEVTLTPVAAPTGLAVTQASATSASLTWSAVTGATSYNLYRSTTAGGEGATPVQTGLTGTSYTNTGLTSGTTYYYKLTAVNATAESPQSSEVTLTPLAAPTGVTGTTSAATPAIISWSAVTGATTYTVYRSTTSGTEVSLATGVAGTSYNDTTATRGTTYYYKVAAVNAGATSAQSSEVIVDAINTSSPYYQINTGNTVVAPFAADAYYFPAGLASSTGASITATAVNAAPAGVYSDERFPVASGTLTYTLPGLTPGGSYVVRLHMAENYWTGTGQRLFNLTINGTSVLTQFDIWAAANGIHTAVVRNFNATADGSGNITVLFSCGTVDRPTLDGLEILSNSVTAAPTSLAATQSLATSVALTWGTVAGATTYNLYRSTSAGTEGSTPYQTGLASASYTDAGVTAGTTYYYKVVGVNAQGESALSSETSFTPLASPTSLAATQASASSASLTWAAVTGATTYNLYRSTTAGGEGSTPVQTGLTGTSYTDTGLISGTTYYYKLTAVATGKESAQSSEASLTPLAAPTGLAVTEASATSSTVTWTAVTGATSYNLYRSTTAGGEGATPIQTGLTGTSYTNTGLTSGTTYYYKLTAVNATAESPQSSEVSLTPLAAPTGVAATPGNAQVALAWTAVTGATSYTVYRGTTPGSETSLATGIATASYTDSTAANNTTYFYVVQAVSAGTTSANSSEVAATPGGANGLLGWWKLDENTGTTTNDASGFSNTGTFSSAGWAIGRNGYAGSFNGSSRYIDAGKGVIATANSFSVACWVKMNSSAWVDFVSQDGVNVSNFFLQRRSDTGKFEMDMFNSDSTSGGTTTVADSTTTPVTGVWYHLVGVYDAPNNQIKLYVNGTLEATTAFTTPWSATGHTFIGRGLLYGSATEWASGLIDDVRLYNRLLTAAEISTISAYPTGVTATGGNATATISWTAFPSATSYNLYRSITAGTEGGTPYLTGLAGTSYTNSGLTNGTTYYYKVAAVTASGESAHSDEVSAGPNLPPAAPTALTAVPGNASATLSWTAATGGGTITYTVLRSTTNGSGYVAVTGGTGLSGTSFTDPTGGTALTNGTVYYYVVTATNNGGTSGNSAQAAVTPSVPTLILTKRITAVNGVSITGFVSDGTGNDANAYWPTPASTYLRGGTAATAKPGDTVEYTIYFLATGSGSVTNVVVSNVLPAHVIFAPTSYNSLTPTDGGSGNSGLALASSATAYPSAPTVYLSNTADSDRGTFYAPGVAVAGICTAGQNVSGVLVVNVVTSPTTLPAATSASSPYNAYGFVRYQVTIR